MHLHVFKTERTKELAKMVAELERTLEFQKRK